MHLHRIVPNLDDASTGHDFYEGFLELRKEFDLVRDRHGVAVDVVGHTD